MSTKAATTTSTRWCCPLGLKCRQNVRIHREKNTREELQDLKRTEDVRSSANFKWNNNEQSESLSTHISCKKLYRYIYVYGKYTYHPWVDSRRAARSCLSDSQSRNSDAWQGMDNRGRCADWGTQNPGRPVDRNADRCRVYRRNCKQNRKIKICIVL